MGNHFQRDGFCTSLIDNSHAKIMCGQTLTPPRAEAQKSGMAGLGIRIGDSVQFEVHADQNDGFSG
jgi:hypothetical protein